MSKVDIVRAWKDPAYRRTLSAEQLAALPTHPAGMVELSDDQLSSASGAKGSPVIQTTALTCTQHTFGNWKACGCGAIATTAMNCTNYTFQGWAACGC